MTTCREYFTALWVDPDEARLVESGVESDVNRKACFGSPDWGCDICPCYDDCEGNARHDLERSVVVLEEWEFGVKTEKFARGAGE